MISVKKIPSVKGKYVLVRTGFDVPVENGKVVQDVRIRTTLPTIQYLTKKGARVILLSHIGRDPKETLEPVYRVLKKFVPVTFVPEIFGDKVDTTLAAMKNGDVVMLENLRSDAGEKGNDKTFAKKLAAYGDFYVNEAFLVSHRADASIVTLPKLLPSFAGIQLEREVVHLSKALNPKHPFVFIQGGAKAETKIPLIKQYLKIADYVFVGGALANDFYKAKGYEIGTSVTSTTVPPLTAFLKNPKLILPTSVIIADEKGVERVGDITSVTPTDKIRDIAPKAIAALEPILSKAKLVLWNGPMGWYEKGDVKGTQAVIKLLLGIKGMVIIGGGDTAVLVDKKKLADKFTFVSTGGGATLEFLAKGTLPGIKALT